MAGILCSGSIVYDILTRPVEDADWGTTTFVDTIEFHVGGNGANTARALAIVGAPVRLLGAVGADPQGAWILEQLRADGVDTSPVVRLNGPTAASVALVRGDGSRKFLHRLGVSRDAFETLVEFAGPLVEDLSHYHLASLFLLPRMRAQAPAMLAAARGAGLATSLDTNWDAQGRWMLDLEACLPHLDFLFMNEDEARMVTGSQDPSAAARLVMAKGVRTAVMKLGARGCAIFTQSRTVFCPGFAVEARDTTGAGDSFVAGFLAALLDGAELEAAGHFANAVGALSVQRIGAVTGLLPHAETEAWMRSARLRRDGPDLKSTAR